jgi:hypothetical protein
VPLAPPHDGRRVEAYYYLRSLKDRTRVGETWGT